MTIQIGLPCNPEWLCAGIGWVIGLLVIVSLVGLINLIVKDQRRNKKKRPK